MWADRSVDGRRVCLKGMDYRAEVFDNCGKKSRYAGRNGSSGSVVGDVDDPEKVPWYPRLGFAPPVRCEARPHCNPRLLTQRDHSDRLGCR
jgi:hypothetical protein